MPKETSMPSDTIIKLHEEHAFEKELLSKFLDEISAMPVGGIHSKIINGRECCYHYIPSSSVGTAGKLVYIRKEDAELLSGLCRRRFLQKSIKSLQKSIKHREKFLLYCSSYNPNSILSRLPKSCANLCYLPISRSQSENVAAWIKEPFEKSTLYPEQLIYATPNGIKVRSKSEL
ncbi:MAG: hypothetical protein PHP52_14425, partial [Bacteroidales bacterium]|nr:hypothetical protein [Bacteroidales bacterium]